MVLVTNGFCMDRELREYLERQFAEASKFREKARRQFAEIHDEVRRTRVLVEKLDDKVDLVAEGRPGCAMPLLIAPA